MVTNSLALSTKFYQSCSLFIAGMNGQMKHSNAITMCTVPRATAMTTAAAAAAAETQWEALPSESEGRHTCKPTAYFDHPVRREACADAQT